jgi:hypothetical protein
MRALLLSFVVLGACSQARMAGQDMARDMTMPGPDLCGSSCGTPDMAHADLAIPDDMSVSVGDMAIPVDQAMPVGDIATTFNVTGAAPGSNTTVVVTFDAPPDMTTATTIGNYDIPGLALSGTPVVSGNTVTLTSASQDSATTYMLTVSNVTRASDGRGLTTATAMFNGRASFNVTAAASASSTSITVTFDAPPDPTAATTLTNYGVGGLSLLGTPQLAGSVVTLKTSGQAAMPYTVTVSNVTRMSDGEALTVKSAVFTGTAVLAPTVTNVVVASTVPDNGTKPYNTGTITVTITGTDFATVACPAGVVLDDIDGAGTALNTAATSCTVDSDTQITATFPAGLRTNGTTGWNVKVTNSAGSNTTSTVKLAVLAGIVISEVYIGNTGGVSAASREFVEIYNQTQLPIDISSSGIDLHLRVRTGTGTETGKTLMKTASGSSIIPAHGYLLFSSSASAPLDMGMGDAWFAHADFTYSASIGGNGAVAVTLSATTNVKVLDRVGWGTQPTPGFEGMATPDISTGNSIQRIVTGHVMTDADNNSTDFSPQSTAITPQGTIDPALP